MSKTISVALANRFNIKLEDGKHLMILQKKLMGKINKLSLNEKRKYNE